MSIRGLLKLRNISSGTCQLAFHPCRCVSILHFLSLSRICCPRCTYLHSITGLGTAIANTISLHELQLYWSKSHSELFIIYSKSWMQTKSWRDKHQPILPEQYSAYSELASHLEFMQWVAPACIDLNTRYVHLPYMCPQMYFYNTCF